MKRKTTKALSGEYFLFLLPAFFLFHGFTEKFPLVGAGDCLWLLLQYLLAAALLSILFYFLLRSWRKAAIVTLLLMSFHFFFGSLHDAAKSVSATAFFTHYSFILPFSFILLIVLIFLLKRSGRKFDRLVQYVNVVLLVFILIDAVQLLRAPRPQKEKGMPPGFMSCDSCPKPDIYFIIADEYAGRKELNDIFHFDNSSFEDALKARGFYVADSSVSNYNYTPFSTASVLSMNYLTGIEGRNKSKKDRHLCYELIDHNAVIRFLAAEGYSFQNLSVFQFNGQLPPAPSSFFLTGRELVTSQTFFSRVRRDIGFNLVTRYRIASQLNKFADRELSHVQYLLQSTKNAANENTAAPRFIYTHLMMPHYPYFFTKEGKKNPPEMALEGSQTMQAAYIGYLQYSNSKFLELIDFILSHSKKPPIIIFMGDHGFRHFTTNVDHRYYFMNLNAVYLPGRQYDGFYKGISAVNQFRIIFNNAFKQHLPLLKDSTSFLIE